MSRWDSMVSAEAWDRLVREYHEINQDNDFAVAELLRNLVHEIEGD